MLKKYKLKKIKKRSSFLHKMFGFLAKSENFIGLYIPKTSFLFDKDNFKFCLY